MAPACSLKAGWNPMHQNIRTGTSYHYPVAAYHLDHQGHPYHHPNAWQAGHAAFHGALVPPPTSMGKAQANTRQSRLDDFSDRFNGLVETTTRQEMKIEQVEAESAKYLNELTMLKRDIEQVEAKSAKYLNELTMLKRNIEQNNKPAPDSKDNDIEKQK